MCQNHPRKWPERRKATGIFLEISDFAHDPNFAAIPVQLDPCLSPTYPCTYVRRFQGRRCHWTGGRAALQVEGNIVAIATRHADAVDVSFLVNGRSLVIAMPLPAWAEFRKRTGNVITDYLAAQIAGRYLKQSIENGYDNGREIYTMTVDEVLAHLDVVMREAGNTGNLPVLPILTAT